MQHAIRTLRYLLVVAFLFPLPLVTAEAPGEPYVEAQTGISFPVTIGTLRRRGVRNFATEDPKLGVRIRYSKGEACYGDLYIYDFGIASIPSDPQVPVIRHQLQQALGEIRLIERRGDYQDVREAHIEVVDLGARGGPKAQRVVLSYLERGERQESYLYVTGSHNRFVKLRFTFPERVREDCLPALRELSEWLSVALK